MPKIDRTVLVFSSSTQELEGLRSALEPVVGKYREAATYGEACSKAQNERIDLVVLGSDTEALKEYLDFYPFARNDKALKDVSIFVWAPTEPPAELRDHKVRFFEKGQYRLLVEGLDEFATTDTPEETAAKTRQALPVFLQNLVRVAAEKLGQALNLELLPQPWSSGTLPAPNALSCLVKTQTSILEGFYAVHLSTPEPAQSMLVAKAMEEAIRDAALNTLSLFNQKQLTDFHSETSSDLVRDCAALSTEAWTCLPLHNSSQKLIAQVFVKIRPKKPSK